MRDRIKFRVGQIVYVAFSRDETRDGLRASPRRSATCWWRPSRDRFMLPRESDMRFNWVRGATATRSTSEEMRELVLDAWRMVVPKKVSDSAQRRARRRRCEPRHVPA